MKDMLTIIYNQLYKNTTIQELVNDRIYFYAVSDTVKTPFICIRPLDVPTPTLYASNKEMSIQFTYQIEAEVIERMDAKILQKEIKKELFEIDFFQLSDGLDVYFKETKHYVDARRYRANTKLYDTEY